MLLENKDIQAFKKLWNQRNEKQITEDQAREEAQRLLTLINLIIQHTSKKYEN